MRPDSWLRRCTLILAGTLFGAGLAVAAPVWSALDAQQKALIAPALLSQGGDFDALPESRRAALVRGADRWLAMTPAQRTTATRQLQRWQGMTMAQKVAALERRERFRKMSPEQRKALLETQRQFEEMPLQQQVELRGEFEDLQPAFDGLPSQPFGTPTSPTPGAPPPLGLPGATLPNSTVNVPALPR